VQLRSQKLTTGVKVELFPDNPIWTLLGVICVEEHELAPGVIVVDKGAEDAVDGLAVALEIAKSKFAEPIVQEPLDLI
jgi:hypothetical protein